MLSSDTIIIGDIQTELLIRGYKPGVVDGKLGPGTRSAIKAMQRDRGFPETGTIDNAVLKTLNIQIDAGSIAEPDASVVAEQETGTIVESVPAPAAQPAESVISVNGRVISVPNSASQAAPKRLASDAETQNAGRNAKRGPSGEITELPTIVCGGPVTGPISKITGPQLSKSTLADVRSAMGADSSSLFLGNAALLNPAIALVQQWR